MLWAAWRRQESSTAKPACCFAPGKVTKEMMAGWLKRANVELRGGGLDESPDGYKHLDEVLEEHGDSIRILRTLTPVGVAMAGAPESDPYKDELRPRSFSSHHTSRARIGSL